MNEETPGPAANQPPVTTDSEAPVDATVAERLKKRHREVSVREALEIFGQMRRGELRRTRR